MDELIKYLKENKDKETRIEIKLFDTKNNRVARKNLTVKELIFLEVNRIDWHDLRKGHEK
jgi:hypothetical protein